MIGTGSIVRRGLASIACRVGSPLRRIRKYLRSWWYFGRADVKVNGALVVFHSDRISIGADCVINRGVWIVPGEGVTLGDRVVLSPEVMILCADLDRASSDLHSYGRVEIESDVWVGTRSIILKNVRIGKGSVIGAGSVVTRDIPARVIAAGNPARVIRVCAGKPVEL